MFTRSHIVVVHWFPFRALACIFFHFLLLLLLLLLLLYLYEFFFAYILLTFYWIYPSLLSCVKWKEAIWAVFFGNDSPVCVGSIAWDNVPSSSCHGEPSRSKSFLSLDSVSCRSCALFFKYCCSTASRLVLLERCLFSLYLYLSLFLFLFLLCVCFRKGDAPLFFFSSSAGILVSSTFSFVVIFEFRFRVEERSLWVLLLTSFFFSFADFFHMLYCSNIGW